MESTGKAIPILLAVTASGASHEYNVVKKLLE